MVNWRQEPQRTRGARGAKGEKGPAVSKTQILIAVNGQFAEIEKQLELQLIRTGQLQVEIDRQHAEMAELQRQLKKVHEVIRQALKGARKSLV